MYVQVWWPQPRPLCRNNRLFHYGVKLYVVGAGTSIVLISLTAHVQFIADNRTFYLMLALIVTCGAPLGCLTGCLLQSLPAPCMHAALAVWLP